MSRSSRVTLAAFVIAMCGCGPESPTPDSASNATTTPRPGATTASAARPQDTSAQPATSASGARADLEATDANVSKLLEGGPALSALPTRATDKGAPFDPALRAKLAPAKPTPP